MTTLLSRARVRWFLLALLWAILLTLGISGYLQQSRDAGLNRGILDTLYLSLQLATLQFDGGDADLNWRLEVARFVAPVMAAGTVLQTASYVFHEQFQRIRASFARNHTVVVGLGDVGTRLALALAQSGQKVVAVTADGSVAGVASAREGDIAVVIGDPAEAATLRAARVDRAARLVVVADSDAVNVDTVAVARTLRKAGRPALRCTVQLDDAELCALLRGGDLDARDQLRVNFFSLHDSAARTWIAEHPDLGDRPMVIGLGQLGRSLVIAAAQRWAQDSFADRGPLRMTIIDRSAAGRWHALRMQHPAIAEVCEPVLLDLDMDAPDADQVDRLLTLLREDPPTWAAVAFEEESLALSAALLLHQAMRPRATRIVVRTKSATGLASLLGGEEPAAAFPGMTAFPFLDRTCTAEAVDAGMREQLARGLHEDYLARADTGSSLDKPWAELTDPERESSRQQVDGILQTLRHLSCELIPLRRWGAPATTFSAQEVQTIARRDHERWLDDRRAAGWTHGPTRDDRQKRNPLLVEWVDLPDSAQSITLGAAQSLPALLARAGFEPMRL